VLIRGNGDQSGDAGAPHVDAVRFIQRVARAFESARDQGGEIRLRLSPPELGSLRVEVNMVEQGLVARVEAETPEARTILLENLPALRERLAEQGVKLERFDVDLSQQRSGQDRGQQPDQTPSRQQTPPSRAARVSTPSEAGDVPLRSPHPAQMVHDRRLNVIV
jgi:flagellar hook-length control protein FliK